MSKLTGATFFKWRYFFILFLLTCAISAIIGRVYYLSVIQRKFLLSQGDARVLRTISIPAYRGMITDRNDKPLAVSTPVESVWVDPKQFKLEPSHIKQLALLLHLNILDLAKDISKNKKREFLYIKRRIAPWLAMDIKKLKIQGVYLRREFKRYYPEGPVTAHILGFTNVDDNGQEGLELAFDKWLKGIPGKRKVLKDRYGAVVADIENISDPHPGHNLTLSIDRRIQYLAFTELQKAVVKFDAVSGSIVVLNPRTGEILAMVNQPSFNPNRDITQITARYRNRAVTDVFEPGSTMKAFSVASALDSGKYKPDTLINTGHGYMRVGGWTIHDDTRNGIITVNQVLQKSSNIGVSKMTLSLPPEQLWSLLHRVGFGERTQSGFPGERAGSMVNHRVWRPAELVTLAYGYGISVTTLQLAHAYSVLADYGIKVPVTFLRRDKPVTGTRVMDPEVAKEMVNMLQLVVEKGGTGTLARVPGYHIAGKTGTAWIAGSHGYMKNHHVASFVGIAPATDPKLVVAVVIRDPHKIAYFGGLVAAPVFAKVMSGSLRIMDVAPDNLATLQNNNRN